MKFIGQVVTMSIWAEQMLRNKLGAEGNGKSKRSVISLCATAAIYYYLHFAHTSCLWDR